MKNLVSLIVFALVFLGLGAMALMAAPGGADLVAEFNPSESAGSAPELIGTNAAAASIYNDFSLPLDSQGQFSTFDAVGLAELLGPGIQQILHWDTTQSPPQFEIFVPDGNGGGGPDMFDLQVGGSYIILAGGGAATTLSLVGDVPPPTGQSGAVQHSLVGTSPTCTYNHMMVPLDQGAITTPAQLVAALGGSSSVAQILSWDAGASPPQFKIFVPDGSGGGGPDQFDVKIGYPYWVCLYSGVVTPWPQ